MLTNALLAPPSVEVRVALAQALEYIICSVDRVRRHLFDERQDNLLRLEGCTQPSDSIDNRENPIGQGRRGPPRASVDSLIFGDEEIDGGDVESVQQRHVNDIVWSGHGPKPLFQDRTRKLPNIFELLEFLDLAPRHI